MNTQKSAIINPMKGKNSPRIGDIAVMTATDTDMSSLLTMIGPQPKTGTKLMMSQVYTWHDNLCSKNVSLVGPFIGAPYAVMLLENLIAWGAKKFIFLGLCGSISQNVKIGDILLPTVSISDEGTTSHYDSPSSFQDIPFGTKKDYSELGVLPPSTNITDKIKDTLQKKNITFHEGTIWTTDAVFRETKEKVIYLQKKDVLAVDMETSALFAVAKFRNIEIGAIHVVSDELSSLKWKPGFKDKHFKKNRRIACEVVQEICRMI